MYIINNLNKDSKPMPSREEALRHTLRSGGGVNESDIRFIESSGSRELKNALDRKAEEMHREKKHLDRVYGKDVFDAKDNQGNPFKRMELGSMWQSDGTY